MDNICSKNQKRKTLIASVFAITMQYPHTPKNNIHQPNKQRPPPFFHSDNNPVLDHILVHSFDKTHALVVTVKLIWFFFLNIHSFNIVPTLNKSLTLTRFNKSYVNRSAVVLIKIMLLFA